MTTTENTNHAMSLRECRKNQTSKVPEHKCDNCGHMRYSPCGCVKRRSAPVHNTQENAPMV